MTTDVTDIGVGTIRAGILGGGFMARVHSAASMSAGARLTAVATTTPEGGRRAADALRAEHAAADAQSLISAPDVDLVHICTPNASHADLARRSIEAGKHVICEKPLAIHADDAAVLVTLARERGVVAAVPFVYRYHPMVREARARVHAGEIGQILTIDAAYLQDWMLFPEDQDWRTSAERGGASRAFADIGSHLCDLIEFVLGERIQTLSARTRRVYDERGDDHVDNEDIAALLVQTASGALGTLLISQMAAGRKNALTIEVHGTRASLRFEQEHPDELWVGGRSDSRTVARDGGINHPDAARLSRVPAGHPMGYQDAFNSFVADVHAAIAGGEPEGLARFEDGWRAALVTEAVLASAAADGAWTEVAR